MNIPVIANLIGRILCVQAFFLLPAAAVSLYYNETSVALAFGITLAAAVATGVLLMLPKPRHRSYYAREGFVSVALAWIVISVFGALPFYISGEIPNFIDCIFETISGFTTTGASILTRVEDLSYGLLYWRSFTHWLGGMGVLVFLLAMGPMSKGSGQSLYLLRAESPGPEVEKLVPQMHRSAKILYALYIGLTILEIVLLLIGGLPFFDTITVAFGTAGTGGFAIRSDSIGGYSVYVQIIVTLFMALFGINFYIYYLFIKKKFFQALHNEEFRLYIGILVLATVLIAFNINPMFQNFGSALLHSAFQVSSIMTTTGFATTDFNLWPEFSKTVLLILMIIGASAGSTGGGIKVSRLILMFKSMLKGVKTMISPRSVSLVKMDGKTIEDKTIRGIGIYISAYIIITATSVLLLSLDNMGLETTFTAVLACLNNIGPGLDVVGPMGNYAPFSNFGKLILCADMLIGRLEIMPILMLFMPTVWRKAQ